MSFSTSPGDITLTELDHVRLAALARRGAPMPESLSDRLDGAEIVPSRQVPPDVVTMYARLQIVDAEGRRRPLVVCYPDDAEPEAGFVSVLSPLGASLIGCRAGDEVAWVTPDGRRHTGRIDAVDFQPEASGDFTT